MKINEHEIKINNISIKADMNQSIVYISNNNDIIALTFSEIKELNATMNRAYYLDDIISYFTNSDEYTDDILNDTELLNHILDDYEEKRNNADGGEEEDCIHWTDCLESAVENWEHALKKYMR